MKTLPDLLHPISVETFFAEYYEKKPLYIQAKKDHDRYKGFPDFEGFERILWAHELKLKESLRVNKKGNDKPLPHRSTGKDLFRWAIDSFSEGYTLILNGMDNICLEIAQITRAIEEATDAKVAANAFLTPAENRGFLPHFDTHDVFILQLDGTKHWHLYDQRIELPIDRQIYLLDQTTVGEPQHTYVLRKGDFLYVPRGLVHGPFTEGEHSLHLTMGYRPLRWFDYLHALVDIAAELNVDLRRSIMSREIRKDILSPITEIFLIASESARMRQLASERAREKFVAQLKALSGQHIAMTDLSKELTLKTRLRRRREAICNVFEKNDKVLIQFPGIGLSTEDDLHPGSVEAPLSAGGIFRFIAKSKDIFTLEDLPGILDEASKMRILSKLLHEGLLLIVDDPDHDTQC